MRCHYVIVNSTKSNEGGNHWGLGLWDGRCRPDGVTLIDPYANPCRFQKAGEAARELGLEVRLLGARHQTCGLGCEYICVWWALWMGNRGGIPSGSLPQALPTMQGTFPALCQSLLQEGRGADRSKRCKRSLSPAPPIVPTPRLKSTDKKRSESRRDHISIKNIKNQYTHLSDPPTQGPQHREPPEVGLAHIYIPPPHPRQRRSRCTACATRYPLPRGVGRTLQRHWGLPC